MRSKPTCTDSSLAMSISTRCTVTPASAAMAFSLVALSRLRTVPYTVWPWAARWMAVARPMPLLAPVTTEIGLMTGGW